MEPVVRLQPASSAVERVREILAANAATAGVQLVGVPTPPPQRQAPVPAPDAAAKESSSAAAGKPPLYL